MSSLSRSPRKRWLLGLIMLIAAVFVLLSTTPRAVASVTLNYFRATWQPDLETVVIEWQTATELNTIGFIVQRSTSPTSGFVDITEVIPAVGDQLSGWTYDPVADDPTTIVLGTTYWYRLIVINSSPPNDEIDPVAVLTGIENTVTPTNTATRTPTPTPTPSGTPVQAGVKLLPAWAQQQATAGQIVTRTLRLANIGNVINQIYLLYNSSAYSAVVSPLSVQLAADTEIDVSVRVFVPVAPTVYSNTVDVLAIVYGPTPSFAVARVIAVVWRPIYLPIVTRH